MIRAAEELAVSNSEAKMPGFAEVYSRYRAVLRNAPYLRYTLPAYVFNWPLWESLDRDCFPEYTWLPEPSVELDLARRDEALEDLTAVVLNDETDSPTSRLMRVIEASERIPWVAGGTSPEFGAKYLFRHLPDLERALWFDVTKLDKLGIPRLGIHDPLSEEPPEIKTRQLGAMIVPGISRMVRALVSRPNIYQITAARVSAPAGTDGLFSNYSSGDVLPFLNVVWREDRGRYAVEMPGKESREKASGLVVLDMEFVRRQLQSGEGLTCICDVIDSASFEEAAHTRTGDNEGSNFHRFLMEGIWSATGTAAHMSGRIWKKPRCVE